MSLSLTQNPVYFGNRGLGRLDDWFFSLPMHVQALIMRYNEGCPVAYTVEERRGAKASRDRSAEVNIWTSYLLDLLITQARYDLVAGVIVTLARHQDEPRGIHDQGWPPVDYHQQWLAGTCTLVGFALPRLLTVFAGQTADKAEYQTHMALALDLFVSIAADAIDLVDLSVRWAEALATELREEDRPNGVVKLLAQLLSQGKMAEDNLFREYQLILGRIQDLGGNLHICYSQLRQAGQLEAHGIFVQEMDQAEEA